MIPGVWVRDLGRVFNSFRSERVSKGSPWLMGLEIWFDNSVNDIVSMEDINFKMCYI